MSASEAHEGPTQWINRVILSGLIDQTETHRFCRKWIAGTNSRFRVYNRDDPSPKLNVFAPDLFLTDEKHYLLLVVEVAKNQSMKQVLGKMENVWMLGPGIVGVVIIKIEETPRFRSPPANKTPTEPILDQSDWIDTEWPAGPISYDGHVWCGVLSTRIIVCVNRKAQSTPNKSEVRSLSRSFRHLAVLILVSLQVFIEPFNELHHSSRVTVKRTMSGRAKDVDVSGDYGSEAQDNESTEEEAFDGDNTTDVLAALSCYDDELAAFQERVKNDWDVVSVVRLRHWLKMKLTR